MHLKQTQICMPFLTNIWILLHCTHTASYCMLCTSLHLLFWCCCMSVKCGLFYFTNPLKFNTNNYHLHKLYTRLLIYLFILFCRLFHLRAHKSKSTTPRPTFNCNHRHHHPPTTWFDCPSPVKLQQICYFIYLTRPSPIQWQTHTNHNTWPNPMTWNLIWTTASLCLFIQCLFFRL